MLIVQITMNEIFKLCFLSYNLINHQLVQNRQQYSCLVSRSRITNLIIPRGLVRSSTLKKLLFKAIDYLEGDEDRPGAEDVWPRHDPAGGRHRDVPLDLKVAAQHRAHLI